MLDCKGLFVRKMIFVIKKGRGEMGKCPNYMQGDNGKEKCFWFWTAGEVCAIGAIWKECPYQEKISKSSPAASDSSQIDKDTSLGA